MHSSFAPSQHLKKPVLYVLVSVSSSPVPSPTYLHRAAVKSSFPLPLFPFLFSTICPSIYTFLPLSITLSSLFLPPPRYRSPVFSCTPTPSTQTPHHPVPLLLYLLLYLFLLKSQSSSFASRPGRAGLLFLGFY